MNHNDITWLRQPSVAWVRAGQHLGNEAPHRWTIYGGEVVGYTPDQVLFLLADRQDGIGTYQHSPHHGDSQYVLPKPGKRNAIEREATAEAAAHWAAEDERCPDSGWAKIRRAAASMDQPQPKRKRSFLDRLFGAGKWN